MECEWGWTSVLMSVSMLESHQELIVGFVTENSVQLNWQQMKGKKHAAHQDSGVSSARSQFAQSAGKRGMINMHKITYETECLANYPTNHAYQSQSVNWQPIVRFEWLNMQNGLAGHSRSNFQFKSCQSDHWLWRYGLLRPNGAPMAFPGKKGLSWIPMSLLAARH